MYILRPRSPSRSGGSLQTVASAWPPPGLPLASRQGVDFQVNSTLSIVGAQDTTTRLDSTARLGVCPGTKSPEG